MGGQQRHNAKARMVMLGPGSTVSCGNEVWLEARKGGGGLCTRTEEASPTCEVYPRWPMCFNMAGCCLCVATRSRSYDVLPAPAQ